MLIFYFILYSYHHDSRTWRLRVQRVQQNWAPILEDLADSFLGWKYNITPPENNPAHPDPDDSNHNAVSYDFDIPVVDIYSLTTTAHIIRTASSSAKSVASALVAHGYLGATPEQPQIAVGLKTLELYRRIRARKASFSIEAFSKVLCDMYGVSAT